MQIVYIVNSFFCYEYRVQLCFWTTVGVVQLIELALQNRLWSDELETSAD